jgi:hypothetical protein
LTLTFNSLNFKIFNYDFSSFEIIKFFSLHTKLFSFSLFVFQLEKKLEKIFSNKPKKVELGNIVFPASVQPQPAVSKSAGIS